MRPYTIRADRYLLSMAGPKIFKKDQHLGNSICLYAFNVPVVL